MARLASPALSMNRISPGLTKRPRLPPRQRLPLLPAGFGKNPETALVTTMPNWPGGRFEAVRDVVLRDGGEAERAHRARAARRVRVRRR